MNRCKCPICEDRDYSIPLYPPGDGLDFLPIHLKRRHYIGEDGLCIWCQMDDPADDCPPRGRPLPIAKSVGT